MPTTQTQTTPSRAGARSVTSTTRRRRLLAVVAGLLLVGGLVATGWWWRHPESFRPADTDPTVGLGERRAVSEGTLHLQMSYPAPDAERGDQVVLRSAEPRVLLDGARTTFEVNVCDPKEGGIIGVTGPLERYCRDVSPVDGTRLDLDPGGAYLVLSVTPSEPGELRVQGVDLTYSDGLRSGTQPVGHYLWLRFR